VALAEVALADARVSRTRFKSSALNNGLSDGMVFKDVCCEKSVKILIRCDSRILEGIHDDFDFVEGFKLAIGCIQYHGLQNLLSNLFAAMRRRCTVLLHD